MSYEQLIKIKDYVDTYLSSLTCEAEMKMSALLKGYNRESQQIDYRFGMADKVYNYAKSHGKAMRGHTLVWHNHELKEALDSYIEQKLGCSMSEYEKNNPKDFKKKRRQFTLEFLGEYMKNVGEHYPGCYCWDVLNEIVPDMHNNTPTEHEREIGLRNSMWNEYIGKDEEGNDFYIEVLKLARKNLPEGTQLFYNEYGEQHPEKRKAIIEVINKIKAYEQKYGVTLLDGIGLQSHYDLTMDEMQLDEVYRDFSSTGKKIQVTEVDILPGKNKDGEPLAPDKEKYEVLWKKIFELANKYKIEAFTGWGISDKLSWFRNCGCTMVDKDGNIKEFAQEFLRANMKAEDHNEQKVKASEYLYVPI